MKHLLPKYLFLFLLLCHGWLMANAQQQSIANKVLLGIDSSKITTYHFEKNDERMTIDTGIDNFHLFHAAQSEQNPFYYDLGNLGQPVYQFYQWENNPFGFNSSIPALDPMRFSFDNQPLYHTYDKAFSDLKYIVGLKSENLLDAIHSQNITQNFHLDGHYRYINSDGIYLGESTKHQNLFLNLSFVTNNERFHSSVSYLINQFRFQQNGGVTVDSVYENNYINKNVVPVVLQSAYSRMKEESWQFANSYDWGKHYAKKINDTVTLKHYVPFFRLQHTLRISNQYRHSADDAFDSLNYLPLHYASPIIDTFGTRDSLVSSLAIHTYSNQINFEMMPFKHIIGDSVVLRKTLYSVGFEHQIIQLRSSANNWTNYDFNFHTQLKSNDLIRSNLRYAASFDYCLDGYNANDYKLSADMSYQLLKYHFIGVKALAQRYQSSLWLLYQDVYTNLTKGQIEPSIPFPFNEPKIYAAELFYALPKHHFEISFHFNQQQYFNYFDNNAYLVSSYRKINQPYIQLKKDIVIRHWHWNNLVNYNLVQNSEIPMPVVLYRGQVYYENHVFKKALQLQMGVQLNFQDKYFAPQFMPVFDYFYNQQTNFGAQQNWQIFINAKIKHARIFVKADNLTQGIDGHGYYVGKYYPLPDRSFKFGISWRFFDE